LNYFVSYYIQQRCQSYYENQTNANPVSFSFVLPFKPFHSFLFSKAKYQV
jgi:hypothetical protein